MGYALKIFISCFMILQLLGIIMPIVNMAFDDPVTENNVEGLWNIVNGSSYISIIFNLLFVGLWTFGLNVWINLILLLPIKIMYLASAWYIISPAK